MERHNQIIPVEFLLDDGDRTEALSDLSPEALLRAADVIYAIDAETERGILLFGRQKLNRIADSDIPEGARVLRVGVRRESDHFGNLLRLIQLTKGYHDYAETA